MMLRLDWYTAPHRDTWVSVLKDLGFTWETGVAHGIADCHILSNCKRDPDNKNKIPKWIKIIDEPLTKIDKKDKGNTI